MKVGFTCGSFDLLHAGHMLMLEEAKAVCDFLIVGLQSDPTIDRPDTKNKPIQTISERRIQLLGTKFVDQVIEYETESDLYELLQELQPDIRILGADWKKKNYTGKDLKIKCFFNSRNHNWSTSELRGRVFRHGMEDYIKSLSDANYRQMLKDMKKWRGEKR